MLRRNKTVVLVVVPALILAGLVALIAIHPRLTVVGSLTTTRDTLLSLLQIIGFTLLLGLTVNIVFWMTRKPKGTVILPFDMVGAGDKDAKAMFDGKSVSDSLNAELLRILQIHSDEEEANEATNLQDLTTRSAVTAVPDGVKAMSAVSRPKLNIMFEGTGLKTTGENLTPSFADSVTVGVGGATVSVGRLLIAFKQLWTNRDPEIVISGSLQRFGRLARLVARLERRRHPLLICEVSSTITSDDEIPNLVKDLAFKIWQETSNIWNDKSATSARTWTGFKYFTEALNGYHQYNLTGRRDDLESASRNCLDAVQEERGYQILFRVCYNLALACFETGLYVRAEELFGGAIQVHEGVKLESDAARRVADAFNGYGASLAHQKKTADAERAYRQAIRLNPNYRDAYINLSAALVELGWEHEARKELDKAINLRLLDSVSPTELGDLYSSLGFRAKAIETYKAAIDNDSDSGYAHYQLGNLYSDEERTYLAISEYRKAIELSPDEPSPHNALGVIYDNENRLDEAINEYLSAIDLDPEMALPHNNLGIVYDKQDRPNEAIAEYRRAIELDSGFAIAHYNLGLIYEKQGWTNQAVVELETAINLDDYHASSHEWLAFLYTKLGRLEDAVVHSKRAIELDPLNRRLSASLAAAYKKLGLEAEHGRQIAIARQLEMQPGENEYTQANFEALIGNADEAIRLLKIALDKQQRTPEFAKNDSDFDFVKDDPRFQMLVNPHSVLMYPPFGTSDQGQNQN